MRESRVEAPEFHLSLCQFLAYLTRLSTSVSSIFNESLFFIIMRLFSADVLTPDFRVDFDEYIE